MLETFREDKSQLIEHISTTETSEKITWVYFFVLWVLTIVSCVLKMNFHSSYSMFMVESGAMGINRYMVVDFSFDLAISDFYIICYQGWKSVHGARRDYSAFDFCL